MPGRERVRVGEVIDAAVERLPEGTRVTTEAADGLPDVTADPRLLEQVLVNVLENAVKYSPPGAPIRIAAERVGPTVVIHVMDDGIGIPAVDLPHIFDSFYRARHEDRTRPGTGLGLAIARGLVEAMGGTIEAQSPRPDAPADGAPGTMITLTLPVAI